MPKVRRVSGPKKRSWRTRRGLSVAWVLNYRDLAGIQHKPQFASRAAADKAKTDIEIKLRGGTFVHDSASATVEHTVEAWLTFIAARRERPLTRSTLKTYREEVRLNILDHKNDSDDRTIGIGHLLLTQLTTGELEAFKERLLASGRTSDAVGRTFKRLRQILKWAGLKNLIGSNPAQDVRVLRDEREDDAVEIPTLEDLRSIRQHFLQLQRTAPDWEEAFVITALHSGLRSSELRGLADTSISADGRAIDVVQRADRYNEIGPLKTKNAYRRITLPQHAAETLQRWLRVRPRPRHQPADARYRGLVFPTGDGTVEGYANILHRVWEPFMLRLGLVIWEEVFDAGGRPVIDPETGHQAIRLLPKFGIHALRHAACSLRIEAGWNPKRIQVFAGHSNIATTMNIYGHLWRNAERDQELADKAEALLIG
jgi:integrase